MKVIPSGKYLLLKQYVEPSQSKIILASEPKKKNLGLVEDCGDECEKLWVQGTVVQFLNYQGLAVEDHEDLMLVKEEHVIAIHEKE